MKKIRIFCLILAILLGICPLAAATEPTGTEAPPEQTAPPVFEEQMGDSSIASGSHSINAQVPLLGSGQLLSTAGSAILYELNSDTLVYAWNPDVQVHPASLVKILTCLVALENSKLSDNVTITSTAIATLPKGTTLNFQTGEVWTMEQMLYCLMVEGYNDAAVVIAEHVAGSQQAFVNMMNKRAKEIGCVSSVFKNATGFHDDEQLSTARDLVKILKEALKNDRFFDFFSETSYRLPAKGDMPARYMETTNYMMTTSVTAEYYDARVTGGRTGVTEARERCLITTAESKGLKYIAIVMCAKATIDDEGKIVRFGSYEEVRELLNKGFSGFQVTQVLAEDQILTQYPVTNGENSVAIGPSNSVSTVLPSEITSAELSYRYQNAQTVLNAPVKAGEQITTVQVWYGNVCVAQSPVVTRNSSDIATIQDQSVSIEQNDEGLKSALRVILILASVVLGTVGIVYLVRVAKAASRRAQHRRRRKSRRRSR